MTKNVNFDKRKQRRDLLKKANICSTTTRQPIEVKRRSNHLKNPEVM